MAVVLEIVVDLIDERSTKVTIFGEKCAIFEINDRYGGIDGGRFGFFRESVTSTFLVLAR